MPRLDFDITAPDFAEVSKRALARVHRMAGMAAMTWFKEHRLAKRFDGSMKDELRFQKRDTRYETFKARFGASGKPLRYTGQSQRITMRSPVRVTKQRMGIVARGLHGGFNPRQRRTSHPPMWSELARFAKSEQAKIAEVYAAEYAKLLQVEIERASRRRRKV